MAGLSIPDPLADVRLYPPLHVTIDGDVVTWEQLAPQSLVEPSASLRGCLASFARLHKAPDEEIADFYRRYGGIGIDIGWLYIGGTRVWPDLQSPGVYISIGAPPSVPSGPPLLLTHTEYSESLARVRDLSRSVHAAMRVADALFDELPPPADEWEVLFGYPPAEEGGSWNHLHFSDLLNAWLPEVGFTVQLLWLPRYGTFRRAPVLYASFQGQISRGGLGSFCPVVMGVVVGQLLAAITDRGFATCTGCNAPYVPEGRWPRADRAHWCSPACKIPALREYKRKQAQQRRARERQERNRS